MWRGSRRSRIESDPKEEAGEEEEKKNEKGNNNNLMIGSMVALAGVLNKLFAAVLLSNIPI